MDEETKTALRLTEKINDRHELAIEQSRQAISKLEVACSQHQQNVELLLENQKNQQLAIVSLQKGQGALNTFKSKLIGMATVGTAIAVTIWEVVLKKVLGL